MNISWYMYIFVCDILTEIEGLPSVHGMLELNDQTVCVESSS